MSTDLNAGTITFTDRHGRVWDVTLTMLSARRVAASDFSELTKIKLNLLDPSQEMFAEIAKRPSLAMALVWAIVKLQADEMDPPVDETAFLDGLDGTAIEAGKDALWVSLTNFFPDQRTVLQHWRDTIKKAHERLRTKIMDMTPRVEATMDQMMDQALAEAEEELTASMKSSHSPVQSVSRQPKSGRSPFGNS